jgi:hypothetical protein
MDPVILFFILGLIAGIAKSDLKVPKAFYDTLSIYLLISIGIKGGVELSHTEFDQVLIPGIGTIFLGVIITLIAAGLLYKVWKFDLPNSIALAAHYGSVSAVTFAVVQSYVESLKLPSESFMTVILVLLEAPAIIVGVFLAAISTSGKVFKKRVLFHEMFVSRSILLLLGGMLIGSYIGYSGNAQLDFFFIDLFKGFLSLFMLEMGIVAASKITSLKKVGVKLVVFGLTMPFISAFLGIATGLLTGLSEGGTLILATLAASASYIAAPAAMQIAVPQANPTLYVTASLGITFPFNVIIGIPIYHQLVIWAMS